MKNFVLFELKKIKGNKRNIAVIAILFLVILVFVASNDNKYHEEKVSTIKNAKFLADWYEKSNHSYSTNYDKHKLYIYKLFGDISKDRAYYFSNKAKYLENGDRKGELNSEIAYCEAQIEFFIRGYLYEGGSMNDPIIWNTMNQDKNRYSDILGHHSIAEGDISELYGDYLRIPPQVIGNPSTISEAVSYYSDQLHFYKQLKKEHAQILDVHEMKGFNFLYLSFKELFPMVSLLIVMLILADCMSSERDAGSYKFLLLQPISRGKLLLGKAITAVITSLAAILLPFLICFLLIGLLNGFGSPKYQVLMSKDTYSSTESLKGDLEYTRAIARMGDFYSNLNNEVDNAYRLFDYRKGGLFVGISEYTSHSGFEWYDVPNSNIFEPVKTNLFYSYSYEIPNKVVQMINEPFFKLVDIKDFLIQLLPGVILYLIFGAFLALFISTLTQHSTISIVLCILFGGGGSVLLGKLSGNIGRYIPFSFGDCVDILKGVSEYTMKQGVQTLTVTSILLLVLSYLSFRKRDIIC